MRPPHCTIQWAMPQVRIINNLTRNKKCMNDAFCRWILLGTSVEGLIRGNLKKIYWWTAPKSKKKSLRCKDIRICQMNISTLVLCRLDVNYAQNFIQNSFWILKTIGQIYNELQFWWCRLRNNLRQKKNRKKVAYGWVLSYGFDITKTVANMDIFSLLNMNVHYIAPQK